MQSVSTLYEQGAQENLDPTRTHRFQLTMADATGYVLPLSGARIALLTDGLDLRERFAEPVPEFQHSRGAPLVCFVLDQEGGVRYLGQGRRGVAAGTGLRRLNLSQIQAIRFPVRLSEVVPLVPSRLRHGLASKIAGGGLLTRKQFEALVDVLAARDDELGSLLRRYGVERRGRIEMLTSDAREQLAFQKQAVVTALSIAGIDRTGLQEWIPPSDGVPTSFLQGLPQARLREDAMIEWDLRRVPGFTSLSDSITGAVWFRDDRGTRLTVLIANRRPLEQLTGTDLIYFNETYNSIVMVQYKAMEQESNDVIFRLPDSQLSTEIQRMEDIIGAIEGLSNVTDVDGYRLNWNPFFLKFCPRVVFNPDDVSLTPGIYLPLPKWHLLEGSSTLIGKGGGRGLTYDRVKRYLDNTTFARLVGAGWIGTTPGQSAVIQDAVKETLESGRAVVLAVHGIPEET